MKEQVKKLWKQCFHDSEAFVELYFDTLYNEEVNIALQEADSVIAALQMLPYPMTYSGNTVMSGYLSGVCTHPDYRGRGLMTQLLPKALQAMRQKGMLLSMLIPAEPWLFDYYARFGYIRCFDYATFHYVANDHPDENILLKSIDYFTPAAWQYLYHKQVARQCCVLHTEENFRTVVADLQLSGGKIHLLYNGENIKGIALAYPTGNAGKLRIGEVAASSSKSRNQLLQAICRQENADELEVILPPSEAPTQPVTSLGMARILNVEQLLQLHAVSHPEWEMNIELIDSELPDNNGYYHIERGECQKGGRQSAVRYQQLSISELGKMLLPAEQPYMSLMLNV